MSLVVHVHMHAGQLVERVVDGITLTDSKGRPNNGPTKRDTNTLMCASLTPSYHWQ